MNFLSSQSFRTSSEFVYYDDKTDGLVVVSIITTKTRNRFTLPSQTFWDVIKSSEDDITLWTGIRSAKKAADFAVSLTEGLEWLGEL